MSTASELDPPSPPTSPIHLTRALVDAGTISTSYIRAGVGAPLLLLDPLVPADGSCVPLLLPLAAHFRVLAPAVPAAFSATGRRSQAAHATAFSTWLRGFLDGLGLPPVSIVARDECALPSLSFCLTDAPRVERLVLTHRDAEDPALGGETLPDRLDRSGVPILLLRDDPGAGRDGARRSMTEAALRFLRAGDPTAR